MKKVYWICFLFLSWVLGLRAAPAYEGMFCSFSLSSGNMLSFHIFQGVGLAGMKVKAQPFQVRAYSASVTCVDVEGKEQMIETDDFLAIVLQHEIDHLHGITMFERLLPTKRLAAMHDYQEALAHGAKPGETS